MFKDVRLEVEGDVLVVLVEERPAIAIVEFTGTKEFEKDVLVKALKEIGVGEAKIFDKASSTARSRNSSASTCRMACTA
jgi:outer membrane protein insertion porin family